jgi:hypothetical protein
MIRNKDEYERTLKWVEKFEEAYKEILLTTNIESKLKQASLDTFKSQIEYLQQEVDEYAKNRSIKHD